MPLEHKHEHQHAWTHMPWTWIVQRFGIARWEIEYGGRDAPWKEVAEAGIESNESLGKMHSTFITFVTIRNSDSDLGNYHGLSIPLFSLL